MEFTLFCLGLCFSAFFSGSEAVLLSIPIERSRQLIAEGGVKGRYLKFLASRSQEILTTILLGNNVVNVFIASLTAAIAHRVFNDHVITYSVGITSFFILIFGEIIPKIISRSNAESLIVPVILMLKIFYYLFWPTIKPLTAFMVWLLGDKAQLKGRIITKDDIEFLVNQAEKEKSMDAKQLDLLTSILEFPTIKVKDIMVPRSRVKAISIDTNFTGLREQVRESAHSRYPVYKNNLDEVLGFFHIKDLSLLSIEDREKFSLNQCIKPPFYVYEHMKIQGVFEHMNRNRVHIAFVKDENGVLVGIVTLEDIMEEIFGEIQDEHDTDEDALPIVEGSVQLAGLSLPGSLSLRDLYNEYDVKIPLNDNYSTLAGFILDMLDNQFPKKGQVILWDDYYFELTKVGEDSSIQEIFVKQIGLPEEEIEEAHEQASEEVSVVSQLNHVHQK